MSRYQIYRVAILMALAAATVFSARLASQEKFSDLRRQQARVMLRNVYEAVKKNYYDPAYHGIDLEARYKAQDASIQKAASLSQSLTIVAGFLEPFNDSHLFFLPPPRPNRVQYGYELAMIGDNCYVQALRPGSDAAGKLHLGDQVLVLEGYTPHREDLWKMDYYFNGLAPRPLMHLKVRTPEGLVNDVEVHAKVKQLKRVLDFTGSDGGGDIWNSIRESENEDNLMRQRYYEPSDAVMLWKMPQFDLSASEVDHMWDIARKHKAVVVDLRGNPGGSIETLERMVGDVMNHDVTIAKRIGRKERKPMLAKTRGNRAYDGKIVVLVDSHSASCAELFARVLQLEHRGSVVGDHSAGAVMEANHYPFSEGADIVVEYGASITDADLLMADGKSLEHSGVIPDELVLPSPQDLAAGRDPALARAAALVGHSIEPSAAGKLFPTEWVSQ